MVAKALPGAKRVKAFNHLPAAIELGKLDEGGLLVQARGNMLGRLIFQDLARFD